jgi:hypothetical protein
MPTKKSSTDDEIKDAPILIRAFGEFWRADCVDWEKARPPILGKRGRSKKLLPIDAYEQRGVSVLYNDYVPVYVGKADNEPLGSRLRKQKHAVKRGPRWDRFSWFGIRTIDEKGNVKPWTKNSVQASSSVLIESLEAVLILAVNPLLNARSESFKNAERLYQFDLARPKTEVEKQLEVIQSKLDDLLATRE